MSAWPKELQELGETAAKVERLAITIHNLKQQVCRELDCIMTWNIM